LVAVIAASSALIFMRLPKDAGATLSARARKVGAKEHAAQEIEKVG
jgi:hypothetical protein